jgi:hypothetical protein
VSSDAASRALADLQQKACEKFVLALAVLASIDFVHGTSPKRMAVDRSLTGLTRRGLAPFLLRTAGHADYVVRRTGALGIIVKTHADPVGARADLPIVSIAPVLTVIQARYLDPGTRCVSSKVCLMRSSGLSAAVFMWGLVILGAWMEPASAQSLAGDPHSTAHAGTGELTEIWAELQTLREGSRVAPLFPVSNIRLFGAMKLDMLFNSARPLAPGVPFFLGPDSLTGLDQKTLDINARQSTLGAAFSGPQIKGFQTGGVVVGLFFDGSVVADQYGLLPLQAWGELKNESWRLAAGLQFDVFAPGLPTVLPFSALAASGNAGNSFRGQLRLEHFVVFSDCVQWTTQFALSEPITSTIDPTFQLSEDNGWPNVEGRIALGVGPLEGAGRLAKRPLEIGISGVVGQIRTTPLPPDDRVVADVWGVATDFRWKMHPRFGVAGEAFMGQTLGTYNGGVLQNVNIETLEGIRSSGGWFEVFCFWKPSLHSHFGYGIDDPIDRDVAAIPAALGRIRNSTLYSNLLWDITPTFRLAFEFAWRETNYRTLPDNEGAGFHTQFQWVF